MSSPSSYEIAILYGSETGTARGVAEDLERVLSLLKFQIHCCSLDEYTITNLPEEKYVIFIVATTGQGEQPQNMKSFWNFLLIKDLPNDALDGMKFSLFGLGDSSYKQFNAVARKLYQRLLQLGANLLCERGLGDDQHPLGIDGALDSWISLLIESLQKEFPSKDCSNIQEKVKQLVNPEYEIEVLSSDTNPIPNIEDNWKKLPPPLGSQKKAGIYCKIQANELLSSAESSKITRHLEFQYSTNEEYIPGDVACILPRNPPETVEMIATQLNLNLDQIIKIKHKSKAENKFPSLISIKQLLTEWLAISSMPSRYFFQLMSHFTNDELHQEKCQELSSKEGRNEYHEYVVQEKRNFAEILTDFHTVKIPLEYLIQFVPLIKHRLYSISSDFTASKAKNKDFTNSFSVTLAVVNYKTKYSRNITGICSRFLNDIKVDQHALVWFKKGTLSFPLNEKQTNTPVIMVGPGTGVAPFIGFIQHRNKLIQDMNISINEVKDKTILFFGCRHSQKDFLYKDFLLKMNEEGKIRLNTAFSREFEKKVYVQHQIEEQGNILAPLIANNLNSILIFVCGTSKFMPDQVQDSFTKALGNHLNNQEEGKKIIEELIKKRQYIVEAW